ncbi:MAG: hypothetical protein FJ276_34520 [Planctomycetes bacterium]|nr:hypothetical protein [Planctomycetota bacterium]
MALSGIVSSVASLGGSLCAWGADEPIGEILTPPPPPQPRINGAKAFGVRPGHPVLYTIEQQPRLAIQDRHVEIVVHDHEHVHVVGFAFRRYERSEDDESRQMAGLRRRPKDPFQPEGQPAPRRTILFPGRRTSPGDRRHRGSIPPRLCPASGPATIGNPACPATGHLVSITPSVAPRPSHLGLKQS